MLTLLALLALNGPAGLSMIQPIFEATPTVSLSAIRYIKCDEGSGSGFIIEDDVLVTAAHVSEMTNCRDSSSSAPLVLYHNDVKNDFSLMTGKLPDVLPIKVSCNGYETGKRYDSYGITTWGATYPVFGQYRLTATNVYSDESFFVGGGKVAWSGMRQLEGFIVPGNSGGPIVNEDGYAVGINNVSGRVFFGLGVDANAFSYELKNTVLCK